MTIKSRTIDNLGIDASVRYAKDQTLLEPHYTSEESRLIPQRTEIATTRPCVPSEFDQLFSTGTHLAWALFSPPPNEAYGKRLFSYQLIPSLGGYEKLEADASKLEGVEDLLQKDQDKKRDRGKDQEEKEEKEELKMLKALFQCIEKLDKTLSLINARRNQYQRG